MKLALLAGPAAALAVAAPAAATPTFTPTCIKPGASTNVANRFASTLGPAYASAGTVLVAQVWKGDDGVVSLKNATELPRGPVTNSPDPNQPGSFIPDYAQTLTMPPALKIGGDAVLSYTTSTTPYGSDGTAYSNTDTYSEIFLDKQRVLLARKSVTAGRGARVAYLVHGFRKATPYAHVTGAGTTRHVRLRAPSGDDTCGRSFGLLRLAGLKPGSYRVVVNTSRTSRAGGVSASVRLKR